MVGEGLFAPGYVALSLRWRFGLLLAILFYGTLVVVGGVIFFVGWVLMGGLVCFVGRNAFLG